MTQKSNPDTHHKLTMMMRGLRVLFALFLSCNWHWLHLGDYMVNAIVPKPLIFKKTVHNNNKEEDAAPVLRTIDPLSFDIEMSKSNELARSFLWDVKQHYLHDMDWFALPDYYQDYEPPETLNASKIVPLEKLQVQVRTTNLVLSSTGETDESYDLAIDESQGAILSANTVFGALRGLESFSQLIQFGWIDATDGTAVFIIENSPLYIFDQPRYPFRGLLIDTSRHYLPLELIEGPLLDAMLMNKLNVLHWHITDSQSWPWQSRSYPEIALDGGAYRPERVYTSDQIETVVRRAYKRGIIVMPELDLPSHSQSMAASHPEWMSHCPSPSEPINPANDEIYGVIETLYDEIRNIFVSADVLHLGGDEVFMDCWKKDTSIQGFMKQRNMTNELQVLKYFEERLLAIATPPEYRWRPMVWQELFDDVNFTRSILPSSAIVDVWKDWLATPTLLNATAHGHQVVLSSCWYLDHLNEAWQNFADCDIVDKMPNATAKQLSLVLGGHAAMWGEHADASNFQSRVWPRASGTAERLWSQAKNREQADDENADLYERMFDFRCHMLRRGVNAGPVGPGDCGKDPTARTRTTPETNKPETKLE